jgi:hypothetical protein
VRKIMATEVIEKICRAIDKENIQYQILNSVPLPPSPPGHAAGV